MQSKPLETIRLWSDLHLEMSGNIEVADRMAESAHADLALLAGDIARGVKGVGWAASHFRDTPVAYVLGNHDFYGGDIEGTLASVRQAAVGTQVRVLEKDVWDVGPGLRVLGTTLWTNYALWGASTIDKAMVDGLRLNDSRRIAFEGRRFTPADARRLHSEARAWLEDELARAAADGVRTIVLTHHAPHLSCISSEYAEARDELSPSFASDLTDLLVGPTAPAVWCSGHTHRNFLGRVGGTTLLSNQAGYAFYAECPDFLPEGLLVEI